MEIENAAHNVIFKECCVIGCGISGIALSKWLKEYSIDYVVFEKSEDIAGLWRFQPNGFGVMNFTHINVSKYNYHFSDFPFPDDQVEFMHHRHIYEYAKAYMNKFKLFENVKFNHEVTLIEEVKTNDPVRKLLPKFDHVKITDKLWRLNVVENGTVKLTYVTPFVGVCTGHHNTPRMASFDGQETFKGEIMHSVKYKSATMNGLNGKRVLIVGIGNSSVDAADNLVTEGNCPSVTISTRSGAWVYSNYVSGYPAELSINRFRLALPWKLTSTINETVIKLNFGDPKLYNLNPKHRALQSHPTLSPTLYHHIQRGRIKIKPDILKINGSEVTFENGDKQNFDAIIMCTGYRIMLDYLHPDLKKIVFEEKEELHLKLFELVFSPELGNSIAFIGYVQTQTGGILTSSELQSRWFVYLMTGKIRLPSREQMETEMKEYRIKMDNRFYKSVRHTIQYDPITYNDRITKYYGAEPSWLHNPTLIWNFIFASCGPGQWRLNGIDPMPGAAELVRKCPVPPTSYFESYVVLFLLFIALLVVYRFPWIVAIVLVAVFTYKYWKNQRKNRL